MKNNLNLNHNLKNPLTFKKYFFIYHLIIIKNYVNFDTIMFKISPVFQM